MSVINPRNRLVNFRLSEIEFEKLKAACLEHGARSISEFARSSVLNSLGASGVAIGEKRGRMTDLDQKVAELEIRVDQLLRLLAVAGTAGLERTVSAPVRSPEKQLAPLSTTGMIVGGR